MIKTSTCFGRLICNVFLFLLTFPISSFAQNSQNEVQSIDCQGIVRSLTAPNDEYTVTVKKQLASGQKVDLEVAIWDGADFSKIHLEKNDRAAASRYDKQLKLLIAIAGDDSKIVTSLLERGASTNYLPPLYSYPSPLSVAAVCSKNRIAQYLVEKGANVNLEFPYEVSGAEFHKSTALIWVAENGNANLVKYFLEHGANPDAQETSEVDGKERLGRTVLLASSDKAVIEILAGRVKNIDATADDGRSALINAVAQGKPEIACVLIDHGADLNLKDKNGYSALSIAEMKGIASQVQSCQNRHRR